MSPRTDLDPIVIGGVAYDDLGYCRTPDGDLYGDGPVIHTVYCRLAVNRDGASPAITSSDCIRPGQDGAAVKAQFDAERDRVRFTPPEYRHIPRGPGPSIELRRGQTQEVLVLRGRPRLPDGSGEWTTWEQFTAPADRTFVGQLNRAVHGWRPVAMTSAEAEAIVAEFSARVPTHEFRIVRARLVVDEVTVA